ncbi:RNA polymerase sigma-70 factor [Sphingobacterium lumbrici]|uniref:RNA polymerase sigma-70 factor n=1 Tax=Sphingobacterium lumbrici TaxID=2559600 RepID=UPI0015E2DFD0|nr:RNA polymerase sigma-70 factor [Sphingobacterium lumbrici]
MKPSASYNEPELLQQIAEGNEHAFQTLFKGHRGRLYHYILGIVKSKEIAEELVLDVFLKIWLGRDIIVQIENVEAFLFRIACNKSIDFIRKASKSPQIIDILESVNQIADDRNPERQLIQREYENILREAIDLLPPKRREIYRMSREEGLSHVEIAEKLAIAKSTVANQIVDAQGFIKSFLLNNLDLAVILSVLLSQVENSN